MSTPTDYSDSNDLFNVGFDDDDDLTDVQVELLRVALVDHGKRLGEIEAKMDKMLSDLLAVREVMSRTLIRMKKIADKLGVEIEVK